MFARSGRDEEESWQQTQQTFHAQLLRLAYPDGRNIKPTAREEGV